MVYFRHLSRSNEKMHARNPARTHFSCQVLHCLDMDTTCTGPYPFWHSVMSTRAVCRVLLLPPRRRGGMSRSETFDKVPMGTRQPPESLPVIHYPLRKPCFVSGPCTRPGPSPAAPAQCTGRGCMPADLSGPAVAVGCGATARRVRGVLERRTRWPVGVLSSSWMQLGS